MDKKAKLWDEKSKTFPRYSDALNSVQISTFKACDELGIEFGGKNIIDIGCGTGVWTLHLAQKARCVAALDASAGMLEVQKEDAARLKLKNIRFINAKFEDFYANLSEKFELAFASMSPALNKDSDYEAFMRLAPQRVYLGWEEYRQSDLLEPLFRAFEARQRCFDDNDMENFLKKNAIKHEKRVFSEVRVNEKPRQIAIENAMWHLNMAGVEPSEDELKAFIKDEIITETIKSKIKLLVF